MKIKILLVLNIIFISFVYAETVYKTLDAEGNIIFSDVPSEESEVIEVEEVQILNMPAAKSFKSTELEEKEQDAIQYTSLAIISPKNDVTIRSNEGVVSINVELEPALFESDILVLFMDGKEASSGQSSQFSLTKLDRGTHTVYVAVKNEEGKLLKRSAKVVFHLRKESKLFKKPTNDNTTLPDNTDTTLPTDVTPTPENTDSSPSVSDIPVP
jgi:hypothetical protein